MDEGLAMCQFAYYGIVAPEDEEEAERMAKAHSIRFALDKLPRILKQLRESSGLSQRDVAKALGISSPATISHYENGRRAVHLSMLIGLVELYGYRVDFRLEAQESKNTPEGLGCNCNPDITPVKLGPGPSEGQ